MWLRDKSLQLNSAEDKFYLAYTVLEQGFTMYFSKNNWNDLSVDKAMMFNNPNSLQNILGCAFTDAFGFCSILYQIPDGRYEP